MNKKFYYAFVAIYLTGCLFQIYEITQIYFLYETTTDVRYGSENLISLPAQTFSV
jgi:hypothetical protein